MKSRSAFRPLLPCLIIAALLGCQPGLYAGQIAATPPAHLRPRVQERLHPLTPVALLALNVVALPVVIVGSAFMLVAFPFVLAATADRRAEGRRLRAERPARVARPASTTRQVRFAVRPGTRENGGRRERSW